MCADKAYHACAVFSLAGWNITCLHCISAKVVSLTS